MAHIDFFKLQSKNLLKDFKTKYWDEKNKVYKYNPKFFNDIDSIILNYNIYEDEPFSLMNASIL